MSSDIFIFLTFPPSIPFFPSHNVSLLSFPFLTLHTHIHSLFLFSMQCRIEAIRSSDDTVRLSSNVCARARRSRSSLEQPMTCSPCVSRNATSRPDCNGARPAGHFSSERAGVRDRARMHEQSAAWAFGSGRWMPGLRR